MAEANYGTLVYVFDGDDVRIDTANVTARFDSRKAGVDKEVAVSNMALIGTHAESYELIMPSATTATIVPKKLVIRRRE